MSLDYSNRCPACLSENLSQSEAPLIDVKQQAFIRYGISVNMAKGELEIVAALASTTFKSRTDLYDMLYDDLPINEKPDERSVDSHIKRIRRKLTVLGVRIEAIYGEGYKLYFDTLEPSVVENLSKEGPLKNLATQQTVVETRSSVNVSMEYSEDIGEKPYFKWVELDSVVIDQNYQRGLDISHARSIAQEFEWKYFQPPTLGERPDGTFVVLDGQHRFYAAQLHPQISKVPVYVVFVNDLAEEADIFVDTNKNRLKVNAVDLYWAGISAGKVEHKEVEDVLNKVGVQVVDRVGSKGPNKVSAVKKLLMITKRSGKEILSQTLTILKEAFPRHHDAFKASYVQAVANLLEEGFAPEKIRTALSGFNPETLEAKCRGEREGFGVKSAAAVISEILKSQISR